jgi:hypothetical protein
MLCEEARKRLAVDSGLNPVEAEAHLDGCAACFEWLEARDPLLRAVRAARPPQVEPAAELAPRVLAAWDGASAPAGPNLALWGLAAAVILLATLSSSRFVLNSSFGQLVERMGGWMAASVAGLLGPVPSAAGVAVAALADHPVVLLALGGMAVAAALGWARIYVRLDSGLQTATR